MQPRQIDSDELSAMRTEAETLALPATCTIARVGTVAVDATGAPKPGWETVETGVACRISSTAGGNSAELAEQFAIVGDWMISVAYDTDLQPGDQVVCHSDTYQVLAVADDHDFRVLRRATLKRIDR